MGDWGYAKRHGSLCKHVFEPEPQAGDFLGGPCALAEHVAQSVRGVSRPQHGSGVEALQFEKGVRVKGQSLRGAG